VSSPVREGDPDAIAYEKWLEKISRKALQKAMAEIDSEGKTVMEVVQAMKELWRDRLGNPADARDGE
jgi:hypothetical protein